MKYLFVCLLLLGCSQPPQHLPTNGAMPPPSGAVDYCKRNPQDENCKQ